MAALPPPVVCLHSEYGALAIKAAVYDVTAAIDDDGSNDSSGAASAVLSDDDSTAFTTRQIEFLHQMVNEWDALAFYSIWKSNAC